MGISFTVPGVPVAKARARIGKGGNLYTPKNTRTHERLVALTCKAAMERGPPLDGPVDLGVTFFLPIPESWPKKKKDEAGLGMRHPASRPDIDNLLKTVLDGMNGIAWEDDRQVVAVEMAKRYSRKPRTIISVGDR